MGDHGDQAGQCNDLRLRLQSPVNWCIGLGVGCGAVTGHATTIDVPPASLGSYRREKTQFATLNSRTKS